jgi:hypothetical protein
MKLNANALAAAIFVLLFGGISVSSALNLWRTESSKVPAAYTAGEAAGQYNPADIRGSYTFGEVSRLFGVPLADLQTAFRLPAGADPGAYPLKSLEEAFTALPVEMGTGSVRLFVAFYNGLPYDLSVTEDTYLFPEAANVLAKRGKMKPEQAAYLAEHIVPEEPAEVLPTAPPAESSGAAQPAHTPTVHAAPANTVTGKTTFQDLLNWGLSPSTIEAALGGPAPAPAVLVKDYANSSGLSFSTLKAALQAELDKSR